MPKFLASIDMNGNDIDLAGGSILNANIPQLDRILIKLEEALFVINALKPDVKNSKKTTKAKPKRRAR